MNILSEEQAVARHLSLRAAGLLEGLAPDFLAQFQSGGAFVEYNQQVIVAPGEPVDYVSCIVAGGVKIARLDADYAKVPVARLGVGDWLGVANLFTRAASAEEAFADGEVVLWTIPPDTLRDLFLDDPQAVPLLYNLAAHLAQKLAARGEN